MERVFTQTYAACGAIIERDGKILLVHENLPGSPDDGKWSHPAGWIEVGDDPLETVRKEVSEETGFEFEPTGLLGIYSIVRLNLAAFWGATPHGIKLIFIGKIGEYSEKNLLGDTRGTQWFKPEEIFAMDQKTLRDVDIKQMVRDYFSGKRYPLEIITHTIMEDSKNCQMGLK